MRHYMLNQINNIRKNIRSQLFINCNTGYRCTIFLAGTGRSGTTWISDIINYRNEYRYMFEPFYPNKVSLCQEFQYRQYLRQENRDKTFIEPAMLILSGKVRNYWIDRYNKKYIANKRLIKDIRANFLLKWLFVNFPGIKIVLLFRHPCAVASSKLKLGWGDHLEVILSQDELLEDFINPFKKEIKKRKTVFEKYILLWCIENYIPLKQFNRGDIHLGFYENFCVKPRYEVDRLFSFLNKRFDEGYFKNLKKPSSLSRRESAIRTGGSLIDDWKKHITNDQIRGAVDILSLFGLEKIYAEDSMPNIENAYKLMNES